MALSEALSDRHHTVCKSGLISSKTQIIHTNDKGLLMQSFIKVLTFAAALTAMTGCSTWDKLNDTEKGAVIGTGSGAAVGGAIGGGTGALIGGVGGGAAGGLIGNQMDKNDRRRND